MDRCSEVFIKNENMATESIIKMFKFMFFIFVLIIPLKLIGIFIVSTNQLIIIMSLGLITCITPIILYKMDLETSKLKYISIICSSILFGIFYSLFNINTILGCLVPITLSLLYFDRKLILLSTILSSGILLAGEVISSNAKIIFEYDYQYIALHMCSFCLQLIILGYILLAISSRVKSMLAETDMLHNNISCITEENKIISEKLKISVADLLVDMNENSKALSEITSSIQNVTHNSKDFLGNISSSNKSIDKIVITISSTETSTKDIVNSTNKLNSLSHSSKVELLNTAKEISKINDISNNLYENINDLSTSSKEIVDAVKRINEISSKSNMLSLNASIEAARAGEAGKGFGVVANEIKNLSTITATYAQNIGNMIEEMNKKIENTSEYIKDTCSIIDDSEASISNSITGFDIMITEQSNIIEKLTLIDQSIETLSKQGIHISGITGDLEKSNKDIYEHIENISTVTEDLNTSFTKISKEIEMIHQVAGTLDL